MLVPVAVIAATPQHAGGSGKGYRRVAGSGGSSSRLVETLPDLAEGLEAKTVPVGVGQSHLEDSADAGPHVRWCERGQGDPAPYSIPSGDNLARTNGDRMVNIWTRDGKRDGELVADCWLSSRTSFSGDGRLAIGCGLVEV